MIEQILDWLANHYIEVTGAVSGLVYLYFSINQKIWLWPLGIITSVFYVSVFFDNQLYADMGLNVYYVVISIFGWYHWLHPGKKEKKSDDSLVVQKLSVKAWFISLGVILGVMLFLALVLIRVPSYIGISPSDLPVWDAFTTAGSILATWMLAKKILDNWLLWIVVDSVSFGLYIYKELYATAILFLVYTVLAVVGYMKWKEDMSREHEKILPSPF